MADLKFNFPQGLNPLSVPLTPIDIITKLIAAFGYHQCNSMAH